MMKRLPTRNNTRAKGIRVKHVLQIVLLLGVCFWLIYQVKHNHDKKKEFDDNDAKLSVGTHADQILKLGRKDLHPGKDETNQNEKHKEEEEDENITEDGEKKHEEDEGNKQEIEESEDNKHEVREQGEEENKVGAEEQEEDENKSEEMEDERRGGEDDEIDENDQDKTEVDTDRDEEFVDEEKEKEEVDEKENENSEDEEKGGLVENHNTHEAREEHYKGDDASSAVTHDTHTTSTEAEALSLENSDVNLQMNITKRGNETTRSDESNSNQNGSDLKDTEGELTDRTSSNATSAKELEAIHNVTSVITDSSNNWTGAGVDTSSSSEQKKTLILSESDHGQNATVNTTVAGDAKNDQTEGLVQSDTRISEENRHDSDSTAALRTENGDAAAGESSNLGDGELGKTTRLVGSNETENNSIYENTDTSDGDKSKGDSETSETEETRNADATEDEMFKGDTQTGGETDEMTDSSSANGVEDEAIDSSDTTTHEDAAKSRTDLDTLPDIRNEGDNGDETEAE